jgi:hypothetical protein
VPVVKRLLKLLVVVGLLALIAELLRRRPAPPSASPTAPPTPATPHVPVPTQPWVAPEADGSCPPSYPIKAKLSSRIFHVPGGALYDRTVPDRCYASPVAAEADGLRPSKR